MSDHAMNPECREEQRDVSEKLNKLIYIISGNGNKEESILFRLRALEDAGLVKETHLDEYITKDELTIRENELLKNLVTKEDFKILIETIEKKFVRKSETKRSLFTLLKAFGVAALTVGGSIIVAIIMKGV